jgi:DNA-binding response OmpR family regulator
MTIPLPSSRPSTIALFGEGPLSVMWERRLRELGHRIYRLAESAVNPAAASPAELVVVVGFRPTSIQGSLKRIAVLLELPVLVTVEHSDDFDRAYVLLAGANDVVDCSVGDLELQARVSALIRERRTYREVAVEPKGLLDHSSRTFERPGGSTVNLTATEFAIVHTLLKSEGLVVRRVDLLDALHIGGLAGSSRSLDVHMSALRSKVRPRTVTTVRGIGWRLERFDDSDNRREAHTFGS